MPWNDGIETGTPAHDIAASDNGRIRVVAGPGTGKSFAMKKRVARLLEKGVEPKAILPVTFTRVAAGDLHAELSSMNVPRADEISGTTLHSLAFRILARNNVHQVLDRTSRPLMAFEQDPMLADLKRTTGFGKKKVRDSIKAYEAAWARLQNEQPGYAPSQDDKDFQDHLIAWLKFHGAMLIGEAIPQLYQYLRGNPQAEERSEYDHILVDEYQDLNKVEQAVIELLSDNADVCIVGDDDQSIYSFKHAHPEGIQEWVKDNHGAEDIGLEDCRRCPTSVVEAAATLIKHNKNRPVPRPLLPMDENGEGIFEIYQYATKDAEVQGVVDRVKELIDNGEEAGNILVLAQRRIYATPIYEALIAKGISAKSYFENAEIDDDDAKRRFALLKLFVDRSDRVALRWLVGQQSASWNAAGYSRIREHCETNDMSPWEVMEQLAAGTLKISYTKNVVARFNETRNSLEDLDKLANIADMIDYLFPDGQDETRDIRELSLGVLETINGDDKAEFIQELALVMHQPEAPTEVDQVRVMSLHKCKGLSSPVTIIAGCVDGLLPTKAEDGASQSEKDRHLEEQRRLFYVGITRVKADPKNAKPGTLVLTSSRQMPSGDALQSGISAAGSAYGKATLHASRFIAEMAPHAPTVKAV